MTDSTIGSGGNTFAPGMVSGAYHKVKQQSGWLLFLIAWGIWFLDILYTFFDGINVVNLYKSANGFSLILDILYKGILINGIFWLILVAAYFIRKPENIEEFISFLLLLASIFFVLSITGINNGVSLSNLGALIHILFLIFAIRNGILVDSLGKSQANYTTIFLIFLDFFLFNIISAIFPINPLLVNRVFIPLLVIFVLIYSDRESFKWKNIFLFLIIAFYILNLLQTYNVSANMQKRLDQGQVEGAKAQALSGWDKFLGIFTGIKKQLNESNNIISGDYYTGQVEQAQTEKLGVFLEDIKASDQNFMINDSVEVWAKMKAYKLKDMNETIKINVTCYAKKGNRIINGTIDNELGIVKTFSIDSYEEEFLSCKFPGKSASNTNNYLSNESGYYTVTFNATFNFNTQSYLRTYYMEKERKRTLVSQGVNILSQYGITDTNPIAKYTNGPIMIGIETTSSLPIGVPTEYITDTNTYDFSSYIGITLDNSWKGTIKDINWMKVTLPEGMNFYKDCESFGPYIIENNRKSFFLTEEKIKKDSKNGIKFPKSYKCAILLENPINLLGTSPLSIKTFYVSTSYIYQISESTSVNVKNG